MQLLRSQGLGVICGQLSVLLLGVGSVLIAARRQTTYADLALDDLRFFFERPSPWHLWFYLLLGVMVVYALNTVLCTWQNVASRIRMRVKSPALYAPAVMHLAFLAALLAHLIGGVWGRTLPTRVVGPEWSELPWGVSARTVGMSTRQHPDGSFAGVAIELEYRLEGKEELRRGTLGFNQPVVLDASRKVLLIGGFQERPVAAVLSLGERRCELLTGGEPCPLGRQRVQLLGIERAQGLGTVARFQVLDPHGSASTTFGAWPGLTHTLPDGTAVKLEAIESRAFVGVSGREMPGNLWALLGTALLGLGVLLHGRRWL
ncbi:MAG: hypothetical protein P1V51_02330 [Deltaproteobacteria bacterium]|nr:hypothetical protein [Deltaproteobacteria bacterium]